MLDINISGGGFVDSDASPRRGRNAKIFFGLRPSKFEKYLRQLLKQEKEMLFINAWNEGGGGGVSGTGWEIGVWVFKGVEKGRNRN